MSAYGASGSTTSSPFIEDQFFGDPDQIARFRFKAVMARHQSILDRYETATDDNDPTDQPAIGQPSPSIPNEPSSPPGGDREYWMSRAQQFPPPGLGGAESHRNEMNQVVVRYVEFALGAGQEPWDRSDQLVEEFLAPHDYSESTKTSYRSHVRRWCESIAAERS